MSVWERIDSMGDAHALDTKADKRARQRFAQLMDDDADTKHVRLGLRRDGTTTHLIGTAKKMHGPTGCCTCCPRKADQCPT